MSATQNGFASRDNWRAHHRVVPEVSAQSSALGMTGLLYLAKRAPRGPGLDKFSPAQIISTGLMLARFANRHFRDRLDHPFKVRLTNRSHFGIRRRITKIDRHRHAIADGELDRVQVVTE